MAKVTITIEDRADGKVSVVCDPKVETFFKMDLSGHSLTSAQGYAIAAINLIHRVSKDKSNDLKIHMPHKF